MERFIFVIKHSRFNWLLPLLNVLHFVDILNDLCTHPTSKQWFSLHYKILNTGILSDFNLYSAWIIYALNQADFILLHSEEQRHFCMLRKCKVGRRRMGSRSHATVALCYCCFIQCREWIIAQPSNCKKALLGHGFKYVPQLFSLSVLSLHLVFLESRSTFGGADPGRCDLLVWSLFM